MFQSRVMTAKSASIFSFFFLQSCYYKEQDYTKIFIRIIKVRVVQENGNNTVHLCMIIYYCT